MHDSNSRADGAKTLREIQQLAARGPWSMQDRDLLCQLLGRLTRRVYFPNTKTFPVEELMAATRKKKVK